MRTFAALLFLLSMLMVRSESIARLPRAGGGIERRCAREKGRLRVAEGIAFTLSHPIVKIDAYPFGSRAHETPPRF